MNNLYLQRKNLLNKIGGPKMGDQKQTGQQKKSGERQSSNIKPKGCGSCRRKKKGK